MSVVHVEAQTSEPVAHTREEIADACDDVIDPVAVAKTAGLRYVSDAKPGIRRKRVGKHFSYIGLDAKPIHDPEALRRIRSLGIPPAWTNVWICPRPNGHIQATGRDAKGRKQYRYHPHWREVRDETKYNRMIAFGETLPKLRQRVEHDLSLPGLPRGKVLAAVVWLLDTTAIRVGNEEYARANKSFGLTTLRNRHANVSGSKIQFHFQGKSGKEHSVLVENKRLARIVKRCQDLPGHELFQYVDDEGQRRTVESEDVNVYLRQISEQNFSAKDFRTWSGTVFAAQELQHLSASTDAEAVTPSEAKKHVVVAIKAAAQHLGNTPSICRKCYVHPDVINAYLDGSLLNALHESEQQSKHNIPEGLNPQEAHLLVFLQSKAASRQEEK